MKISVIVPVYNVEDYIEKCIKSIRNQSYTDLEIILVDDGSTDRSGIICDEQAREDARISVIHKSNGGLVSARKAGANRATGEYIANVDGDDWIERDYIGNFVKEIETCKTDIVWSVSHIKDYKNYRKLWFPKNVERVMIESKDGQDQLLQLVSGEKGYQNDIEFANWIKCVRREIYCKAQNNVDNGIVHGEDFACTIICLSLTKDVRFIRNDGYHYVQRESSIERNRAQYSIDRDELLLHNIMNYFEKTGINSSGFKKLIMGYYMRARILHDFGSLQNSAYNFLYPYVNVRKGSRLVVYGAGAVGKSIMAYLSTSIDYTVVAWIDSNMSKKLIDGWVIGSLDDVNQWTYDYIVLATNKVAYSHEMREELTARGVLEEKIGEMNQEVMLSVCIRH